MAVLVKARRGRNHSDMPTNYTNKDAVERTIQYITRKRECDEIPAFAIGGVGVDEENPSNMCCQFRRVQHYQGKENYGVRVVHEIVSFHPWEILDKHGNNRIEEIAYRFCAIYYLGGFQAVYGIHMDSACPHIHYIINATNFMDGHKFRRNLPDVGHREEYLFRVLAEVMGHRMLIYRSDDVGWTPHYYEQLAYSCVHSSFLI